MADTPKKKSPAHIITEENSEESPQVFALTKDAGKLKLNRRSFLSAMTALSGAGLLATQTGCSGKSRYDSTYKGVRYQTKENGRWTTHTLPCGSPLPEGTTCTCDCVSGSSAGDGMTCTCDTICTCDTVCSCVGHTNSSHYWRPN